MKIQYARMFMAAAAVLLMSGGAVFASVTDDRIESSAKESFVFRTFLKDDQVKIKSKDGIVTLTGTVDKEHHEALAADTVSGLPGVKSVVNQIKVEGKLPEKNSDAWLTTKVKTAFLFHRNVSAIQTEVDSKGGIVTLKGEADSQAQKDLTTEFAKDVEGVKSVNNKMTVAKISKKPGETVGEKIDDASITAQAKMTLLFNRATSANNTQVETKDGIVKLSGKAHNGAEKDLAKKLVADIHGVKSVVNNMTVDKALSKNN